MPRPGTLNIGRNDTHRRFLRNDVSRILIMQGIRGTGHNEWLGVDAERDEWSGPDANSAKSRAGVKWTGGKHQNEGARGLLDIFPSNFGKI